MEFIYGLVTGLVIGGVVMIFVYRNNKKAISKYADKADEVVKVIKKK